MEHINTKAEFNRQQAVVIQYLKIRILIILKWSITFTPTNEKRFFRFLKQNFYFFNVSQWVYSYVFTFNVKSLPTDKFK